MKCLILAAGAGSRLPNNAPHKVLTPLLGAPLIERVIRTGREAGVDAFHVVTGHHAAAVEASLARLSRNLDVPIRCTRIATRTTSATNENGASVLAAENDLREPFLLTMGDHLFEPEIISRLLAAPPPDGVLLAVDTDLANPLVDPADVTRVCCDGAVIRDIGKHLTACTGYDTGVFYCTPALFDALRRAGQDGDATLSAGVRVLARAGRARAVDVGGRFWIDVDTPRMKRRAAAALSRRLGGKERDGPVARWLNRPISVRLSRRLADWPVRPNQISVFSFAMSVAAAGLMMLGGYPALLAGGILAQLASVVDGCDGEVARFKYAGSEYGAWMDAVLDRYADGMLLFALTWHGFRTTADGALWVIGFAAILGSFAVSYTADKYDGRVAARALAAGDAPGPRLGRDSRVFLIFLGALFNQAAAALWLIAIVMNAEAIRRLVVCRPRRPSQ